MFSASGIFLSSYAFAAAVLWQQRYCRPFFGSEPQFYSFISCALMKHSYSGPFLFFANENAKSSFTRVSVSKGIRKVKCAASPSGDPFPFRTKTPSALLMALGGWRTHTRTRKGASRGQTFSLAAYHRKACFLRHVHNFTPNGELHQWSYNKIQAFVSS